MREKDKAGRATEGSEWMDMRGDGIKEGIKVNG